MSLAPVIIQSFTAATAIDPIEAGEITRHSAQADEPSDVFISHSGEDELAGSHSLDDGRSGCEKVKYPRDSLLQVNREAQKRYHGNHLVPHRTISHYELLEKLGSGGMGVVYKARDLTLDRFVALKILPAEFAANGDRRVRFIREAKAASALNHPGIVTVHEINTETDPPFIALEYVEGRPLSEILRGERLKIAETLNITLEICAALRATHAAGIVHRDLKPSNIMITSSGRVKLLDFGLAKLTFARAAAADDTTRTLEPSTAEGRILGTAPYMSPEQAQAAAVDRRSDIFSLGAVLYEMITGRRAFGGTNTISTIAAIVHQDPRPVRELVVECPAELERIVTRCLKKNPERRFQGVEDLAVALTEVNEELRASPATPPGPSGKRTRRSLSSGRPRSWL
jgi:serine/threonine protein kinase